MKTIATEQPNWSQQVNWHDLVAYRRIETLREVLLPVPWLVLSVVSAFYDWYVVTVIAAFYFFLTGLRVTHNAFHYCLGLSRFATDMVMFVLSIFMLGSHHAIQVTHMRHHRHCLNEHDIEGSVARQGMWETLLKGPLFPYLIHRSGWHYAKTKQRRWIIAEGLANITWLISVWFIFDGAIADALQVFTLLMMLAYCFSAFFAVWSVHHDCDASDVGVSRTLRSRWKSWLFYDMFFHVEHHLFPQVPTCHLAQLAQRLDAAGYQHDKAVL